MGSANIPKEQKKKRKWKPQNTECDNPHVFFKPFNIYQKDESG